MISLVDHAPVFAGHRVPIEAALETLAELPDLVNPVREAIEDATGDIVLTV